MNRALLSAILLIGLGGCKDRDSTENGGVTADEAIALDNAAEMLDTSADSLTATEAPIGNGDMPVAAQEESNGP